MSFRLNDKEYALLQERLTASQLSLTEFFIETISKETGQPAPAREQLHNLNQQSKQELENSLLKEVLAEYTEQWKALKREQNSFLQQMTERMNDLTKTVAGQVTANQLLSQNLAAELNKLTMRLSDPLKDSYQRFATKTEAAEEQLSKQTEKYIRNMDDLISQTEERKNKFFTFNQIKGFLFWAGCVALPVLLFLEILNTFILK